MQVEDTWSDRDYYVIEAIHVAAKVISASYRVNRPLKFSFRGRRAVLPLANS